MNIVNALNKVAVLTSIIGFACTGISGLAKSAVVAITKKA